MDVGVGGAGEDRQGPEAVGTSIVACAARRGGRRPRRGLWWGVSRRSAQMELSARQSQADSSARRWYG